MGVSTEIWAVWSIWEVSTGVMTIRSLQKTQNEGDKLAERWKIAEAGAGSCQSFVLFRLCLRHDFNARIGSCHLNASM